MTAIGRWTRAAYQQLRWFVFWRFKEPRCECGWTRTGDKYGHSRWCPKRQYLEAFLFDREREMKELGFFVFILILSQVAIILTTI